MLSTGEILTPRARALKVLNPKSLRTQDITKILNPKPVVVSVAIAQQRAHELTERFKSPDHYQFFLKVAWRLDEGTISRLAATAFELGKVPRAYFITLVRQCPAFYKNQA